MPRGLQAYLGKLDKLKKQCDAKATRPRSKTRRSVTTENVRSSFSV